MKADAKTAAQAEAAQAVLTSCSDASSEAQRLKTALAAELSAMRLRHRVTLATARNNVESERRVEREQSQYVELLRARVRVAALVVTLPRVREEDLLFGGHRRLRWSSSQIHRYSSTLL